VGKDVLSKRDLDEKAEFVRKRCEAFMGSTVQDAISLWTTIMWATEQGLPEGKLLVVVNGLDESKRTLLGCGTVPFRSAEEFRRELNTRFAGPANAAALRKEMHSLERKQGEAAHAFVHRASPAVTTAVRLGVVRLEEMVQDM
jgi:hypothetical protein